MSIQILSYISLIVVSIYFLVWAADLIEESFVYIAKKLKISEFFMGFAVLGVVSSLPELSVAINSSRTIPELSVGNLLGSTLVVITLVMGLAAIKFKNVNFKGRFRRRELTAALLIILSSIVVLIDKQITVIEGILLILIYIVLISELEFRFKTKTSEELNEQVPAKKIYILLTRSIIGLVLILIASNTVVQGVQLLGKEINVNDALIGLFVLGIGTNTPELALLIRAKNFDQTKLAIGNFLGSVVFNTPTLGLLAVLSGGFMLTDFVSIIPVLVLIVFACILFWYFAFTNRELSRKEGVLLIAIFISLIITEIILAFS